MNKKWSTLFEEDGSALPSVLIMIIIISLMVGSIMAVTVMQGRFIQRDIDAIQARYTAEGAIYQYLSREHLVLNDSLEIVLPDSHRAVVFSESFGGYLKITSEAGNRKEIRVLVGEKSSPIFDKAIVMGDINSKLKLAENTRITGDILTGPLGIKKSNFKGTSFKGFVNGKFIKRDSVALPGYDSKYYTSQIKYFKSMLNQPPQGAKLIDDGRYKASDLIKGDKKQILFVTGNIEIFSTDNVQWPESLTFISTGSIVLDGKIQYGSYSQFIAGSSIYLRGNTSGNNGLFYAKKQISVKDHVRCSGQFLSDKEITISNQAYLKYPSVVNVQGVVEKKNKRRGNITFSGRSVLNGIAMISREKQKLKEDQAKITLGSSSIIRGGIYNAGQTELHGQVFGSILTSQFYYYKSPTTYINWIRNGTVNISKRPKNFEVPFGFDAKNEYKILAWDEL